MENKDYDLICVGAGIMTATLALITKILQPEMRILILERLDQVAQESSAAWNNAGTGHSALCELNYCPQQNNQVDISKAIDICTQFEMSKQFWSYLVAQNLIKEPKSFINPVPHNSWVYGADNVEYLERRFHAMKEHFMFESIEFTRSIEKMKEWFPLIMEDRDKSDHMAGSRIDRGAEMNFGSLTEQLFHILESEYNVTVSFNEEVQDVDPDKDIEWDVITKNRISGDTRTLSAHHVFIGAGGGSLLLLQKVEIDEKEGYGGFPVSGAWLVCKNQEIINQHYGKVYSKAGPNDPPMSTPHLDTRFINGKRELLFGPFAGFSPKFLKEGSYLDLFKSIKSDNIKPMLETFWDNLPLTQYLVNQVTMSFDDRMDDLRKFYKNAKNEDWEYLVAGQRVQIIKKDEFEGGQLQFGTEVIASKDGSITCLLGASPGASTAVKIMLDVIEKAFPELIENPETLSKLQKMIPFYKTEVTKELFDKELMKSKELLEL